VRRRAFLGFALTSCLPPRRSGEEPERAIEQAPPPVPTRSKTPLEVRADELRTRWGDEWTVLTESPFVVIGDETPERVAQYAEHTVRWAVARLKAEYFSADPAAIIDVWLLGSEASYRKMSIELTGEAPGTPYGYYSREHDALVMNIGTGGGTLVHEIVHPFMSANFAACPSWFDEGLASLYEQSAEHDGRIWGLPNWRLPGLQEAIDAKRVPSTKALTETGDRAFYDDDPGTNYAQARYLCLWLQDHGLLRDFYHAFVAAHASDEGGYATLREIIGTKDMRAWDEEWHRWVMTLRFA
jgi:hypothetical protein